MSLGSAYTFAKSRRPEVSPNPAFMRILEQYGKEINNLQYMSNNQNMVDLVQVKPKKYHKVLTRQYSDRQYSDPNPIVSYNNLAYRIA
jgi:hypothetical protein